MNYNLGERIFREICKHLRAWCEVLENKVMVYLHHSGLLYFIEHEIEKPLRTHIPFGIIRVPTVSEYFDQHFFFYLWKANDRLPILWENLQIVRYLWCCSSETLKNYFWRPSYIKIGATTLETRHSRKTFLSNQYGATRLISKREITFKSIWRKRKFQPVR